MPIARIAWMVCLAALAALLVQWWRAAPPLAREDLPWTPLDLTAPVGLSTSAKLAALRDKPGQCRSLLKTAGIAHAAVPDRRDGPACGWQGAVRLRGAAVRSSVVLACPMAAAVAVWMREVVQPAAVATFGQRVTGIEDYGSYACRRIRGETAGWSEHAGANALDVAGFRLADGRRVTVARDWQRGAEGRFLHAVRDGACRVFATTLSPDYNALHRDHLHLDEAARGRFGARACR